ncbi:MAG: malto-oligosyltrehalose trehalohydrolase, partial [Alphaproteobacteria bacterium]
MRRVHAMPFGAALGEDGAVAFRLWAPAARSVGLRLFPSGAGEARDMLLAPAQRGWHTLDTDAACAGDLYQFVIDHELAVPDPASRFQPRDVHGPSQVVDPAAFEWQDADWRGRPWHEC